MPVSNRTSPPVLVNGRIMREYLSNNTDDEDKVVSWYIFETNMGRTCSSKRQVE